MFQFSQHKFNNNQSLGQNFIEECMCTCERTHQIWHFTCQLFP